MADAWTIKQDVFKWTEMMPRDWRQVVLNWLDEQAVHSVEGDEELLLFGWKMELNWRYPTGLIAPPWLMIGSQRDCQIVRDVVALSLGRPVARRRQGWVSLDPAATNPFQLRQPTFTEVTGT